MKTNYFTKLTTEYKISSKSTMKLFISYILGIALAFVLTSCASVERPRSQANGQTFRGGDSNDPTVKAVHTILQAQKKRDLLPLADGHFVNFYSEEVREDAKQGGDAERIQNVEQTKKAKGNLPCPGLPDTEIVWNGHTGEQMFMAWRHTKDKAEALRLYDNYFSALKFVLGVDLEALEFKDSATERKNLNFAVRGGVGSVRLYFEDFGDIFTVGITFETRSEK